MTAKGQKSGKRMTPAKKPNRPRGVYAAEVKAENERGKEKRAAREAASAAKDAEMQAKIDPTDPIWKQLAIERCREDPGWFMGRFVYTYDQHDDADRIKPFPMHRPYFPILLETILRDKVVLLPKSRQLTTSWFLCALTLWKALFFEQSECYVQCINEDTVDYFVQHRIQAIYSRLPDWLKLRGTTFSFCKSRMPSNGSFITGLPSGADKAVGRAPASLVSDELAVQDTGEAFGNALPAIGGDGLAIGVSTPRMKNHFHRMCFPKAKDMKHIETITPFPDFPKTRIERYEKHTVIFLHYTADPDKRSQAWYDAERAQFFAQGKSEEAWAQEYEIDFEKTGMPKLFPSYKSEIHEKDIKYNPNLPVLRGEDFGCAYPSAVFAQYNRAIDQVVLLDAMLLEDCDIDEFAVQILDHCEEKYPPLVYKGVKYPTKFKDYCDHSGNQEHWLGNTIKILRRRHGIRPKSRPSKPEERVKLIRTRLRVNEKGVPGLVVNKSCFLLTEGFRGGFTSKPDVLGNPTGIPFKDGMYEHTLDALGYLIDMVFGVPRDPKVVAGRKRRTAKQRANIRRRYAASVSGYGA